MNTNLMFYEGTTLLFSTLGQVPYLGSDIKYGRTTYFMDDITYEYDDKGCLLRVVIQIRELR